MVQGEAESTNWIQVDPNMTTQEASQIVCCLKKEQILITDLLDFLF